jgi:hypothetical protein
MGGQRKERQGTRYCGSASVGEITASLPTVRAVKQKVLSKIPI